MEKLKEITNDPAKLEAAMKETWAKIDTKGEGSVDLKQFETISRELAKQMNLPQDKEPTPEEKEKAKKLVDPNGTGKINFEDLKLLFKLELPKEKKKENFKLNYLFIIIDLIHYL